MNIKTGLKTLAVALPVALTPMKATAQTVAKNSKAISTEIVHNYNGSRNMIMHKVKPLYVKGNIGAGYGTTPFMHQKVAEPKVYGSLGLTNESVVASVEAAVGKNAQNYGIKIGTPIKTGNPNLNIETGVLFNQNNFKRTKDVPGVVLESAVEKSTNGCVERELGTAFWGAYFKPSYQIGKTNIHANIEGGMAGMASGVSGAGTISGTALKDAIAKGDMVKRSNNAAAARLGVGADVEVAKNLKIGGDYTYSTYDKNSGFNVKATYNFKTKDFRKGIK